MLGFPIHYSRIEAMGFPTFWLLLSVGMKGAGGSHVPSSHLSRSENEQGCVLLWCSGCRRKILWGVAKGLGAKTKCGSTRSIVELLSMFAEPRRTLPGHYLDPQSM